MTATAGRLPFHIIEPRYEQRMRLIGATARYWLLAMRVREETQQPPILALAAQ